MVVGSISHTYLYNSPATHFLDKVPDRRDGTCAQLGDDRRWIQRAGTPSSKPSLSAALAFFSEKARRVRTLAANTGLCLVYTVRGMIINSQSQESTQNQHQGPPQGGSKKKYDDSKALHSKGLKFRKLNVMVTKAVPCPTPLTVSPGSGFS